MKSQFSEALDLLNDFCQAFHDDNLEKLPRLVDRAEMLLQESVEPDFGEGPAPQVYDIDADF